MTVPCRSSRRSVRTHPFGNGYIFRHGGSATLTAKYNAFVFLTSSETTGGRHFSRFARSGLPNRRHSFTLLQVKATGNVPSLKFAALRAAFFHHQQVCRPSQTHNQPCATMVTASVWERVMASQFKFGIFGAKSLFS